MSNSVDGDGGKPIEWLAKSLMRGGGGMLLLKLSGLEYYDGVTSLIFMKIYFRNR
jgi:hypothetical protein